MFTLTRQPNKYEGKHFSFICFFTLFHHKNPPFISEEITMLFYSSIYPFLKSSRQFVAYIMYIFNLIISWTCLFSGTVQRVVYFTVQEERRIP